MNMCSLNLQNLKKFTSQVLAPTNTKFTELKEISKIYNTGF